ncbi:unnamed protein product, partial [Rotaria magnacalcarata]|uniref:Uncharacterized protein n=1 Tax=Rotaria magnacalcarata TaxID=392030 RepID=A0A815HJH1_9BILA
MAAIQVMNFPLLSISVSLPSIYIARVCRTILIKLQAKQIKLMSEFDLSESFEIHQTPSTRDFIALCLIILTILLIIFFATICKWSRCPFLKPNLDNYDRNSSGSPAIQHDSSTSNSNGQDWPIQIQLPISCDHMDDMNRYLCTTKDGLLSPPSSSYTRQQCNDV